MTLLSKAVPNTSRTSASLIRSQGIKSSPSASLTTRRYASSIKFNSNPLKNTQTKSANLPPIWSTKVFELPKPRPTDKQRYESTAGVVESGALILGMGVFGVLYQQGKDDPQEDEFYLHTASEEDHDVHEWIKPFDHYVVEEDDAAVNEEIKLKRMPNRVIELSENVTISFTR